MNLIGCRGGKKRYIFVKMIKNLFLRNDKGGEAETWHTCFNRIIPSTKGVFFFYSSRISSLVAMATAIFHRLIMEKVEIGNFYCLIGDNTEMFIE